MNKLIVNHLLCFASCIVIFPSEAMGTITNFTSWTLTQDPAHALLGGLSTSDSATLTAGNGVIAAGPDVGFASVNGTTVSNSTSGSFFSSASDFSLAINYNLAAAFPFGFGTSAIFIGFGIGEDIAGVDSAGITLGAVNLGSSTALSLAATARVNDLTQPVGSVAGTASQSGTFLLPMTQQPET